MSSSGPDAKKASQIKGQSILVSVQQSSRVRIASKLVTTEPLSLEALSLESLTLEALSLESLTLESSLSLETLTLTRF